MASSLQGQDLAQVGVPVDAHHRPGGNGVGQVLPGVEQRPDRVLAGPNGEFGAEGDIGGAEFLAESPMLARQLVRTAYLGGADRMADDIRYEYKTVQTVRGVDGRVISKMQNDGWELVDQAQGVLRSTLNFRRPKKPLPWLLIGAVAAVLVILAVVIGVASALSGGSTKKDESDKSPAVASEKPSATPTPAPTTAESAAPDVITPQNNPEFAALLKMDYCDSANLDFATKYAGKTVAFDGSIVNMVHHGSYATRYDILLGPGDKGPNTTVGPAFKYENVNVFDLKLTGKKIPATLRAGDKFHFVAKVGEFNATQCLFFLDPVSTETR